MRNAIRFYDRALSRLTRRELLNIAWKLGATAALQPIGARSVQAQAVFRSYPFSLGVASGDPLP
jgi:alkaline phosphatase D